MLGAIVGDIFGSIYEFHNHRSKKFPLFGRGCFATDDSIMTLAVAKAVLDGTDDSEALSRSAVCRMQELGRPYPDCGYGGRFLTWMYSDNPQPYCSFGNGAAMRVSPVAYAAASLEEAERLSDAVTCVTHNHPEGLRGAGVTAGAVWLALHGSTKTEIRSYAESRGISLSFTLDEICPTYRFSETCQETVPETIEQQALSYLDPPLRTVYDEFTKRFGRRRP